MKTFMKLISAFLAVCLLFSLSAAAFAEEKTVISEGYEGLKKIESRLYEIAYDSIDYPTAEKAFADGEMTAGAAGCSSVRNCNFYGRNLDWFFDDCVEIVVHTRAHNGRLATIGVAGAISMLNKTSIDDGSIKEKYGLIPFAVVDGVNEKGVFINVNVVPCHDLEVPNTLIMPSGEVETTIDSGMLVRYVLDNFASAEEAVSYLREHVSIRLNEGLKALDFETHWMLGDEFHTYIIEMIGNKLVVQCADKTSDDKIAGRPIMTNFYLNLPEFRLNAEGKLDINHDGKPNESGITPHGAGLERYNLAVDEYKGADTFLGMLKLMYDLNYSRTYNIYMEQPWYSELVGGDVTNSSPIEDYTAMGKLIDNYRDRDRSKGTSSIWITTHTSIYDLSYRQLYLTVGEEMTGYRFTFTGE